MADQYLTTMASHLVIVHKFSWQYPLASFVSWHLLIERVTVRYRTLCQGEVSLRLDWGPGDHHRLVSISPRLFCYVHYFARNITGYKTVGTLIILLIWLNISGAILLAGGVLNATVQEWRQGEIEQLDLMQNLVTQARNSRQKPHQKKDPLPKKTEGIFTPKTLTMR